jgi:hypothetical protein
MVIAHVVDCLYTLSGSEYVMLLAAHALYGCIAMTDESSNHSSEADKSRCLLQSYQLDGSAHDNFDSIHSMGLLGDTLRGELEQRSSLDDRGP